MRHTPRQTKEDTVRKQKFPSMFLFISTDKKHLLTDKKAKECGSKELCRCRRPTSSTDDEFLLFYFLFSFLYGINVRNLAKIILQQCRRIIGRIRGAYAPLLGIHIIQAVAHTLGKAQRNTLKS